jgi:hypothetical protein
MRCADSASAQLRLRVECTLVVLSLDVNTRSVMSRLHRKVRVHILEQLLCRVKHMSLISREDMSPTHTEKDLHRER